MTITIVITLVITWEGAWVPLLFTKPVCQAGLPSLFAKKGGGGVEKLIKTKSTPNEGWVDIHLTGQMSTFFAPN
ncbi:MAG: hypothetical protein ACRC9V_13625 [Aeromonas sp.]